jgi:PTS system N-acetylglucosamine-specific IIC component
MILAASSPYAVNWYLIPLLGIAFFFIYYFVFSFMIEKFNLKTPGREDEDADAEMHIETGHSDWEAMATSFIKGIGGKGNITEIDNCATRIRLEVKDSTLVDDKLLKQSGAAGVIKPSKTAVQVVVGPKVQFVTDEMKKQL